VYATFSCRIPFSRASSAEGALYFAGEVGAVLRIDDRRRTGEVVGRSWGRVNAEGTVRGVRGARAGLLIGSDALVEVGGVGVGTPLRPEVNCSLVLAKY
jgi:hypothetical protein